MDERAQTLPADGSLAFEGLPAGTMQAFLMLPQDAYPEDAGRGSFLWIALGRFELAEGEALARDFDGTLPGSFTLEVRVNGEPAPGAHLYIAQPFDTPRRPQFNDTADGLGHYGPRLLFPGPWSVTVGRAVESTPLDICPGGATHLVIEVSQIEGSLRLLDANGAALARRSVTVFHQDAEGPPLQRLQCTSDAQGRASFTLAPGAYLVRLDDAARPDPFLKPEQRTVPLTWTAQGPLESEIRF